MVKLWIGLPLKMAMRPTVLLFLDYPAIIILHPGKFHERSYISCQANICPQFVRRCSGSVRIYIYGSLHIIYLIHTPRMGQSLRSNWTALEKAGKQCSQSRSLTVNCA